MSIWNEIYDDYEEDNIRYIDAYLTSNDDESGKVIAKINTETKEVIYLDERAKTDSFAQEIIKDNLK